MATFLYPIGTEVTKPAAGGNQTGVTAGEIDALSMKVMVQWEDYAAPRTEDVRDLSFKDAHPSGLVATRIESEGAQALRAWWMDLASEEIEPLIAKAAEYGGNGRALDLVEIGRHLSQSGVKLPEGADTSSEDIEAAYAELGIYFYLVGKFARWTAAIAEGRAVSDDTLHDIGIYVRMAQRVRVAGGWPQ